MIHYNRFSLGLSSNDHMELQGSVEEMHFSYEYRLELGLAQP